MKKTLILSIIALFYLLFLRVITLAPEQENSHDAFYHVMMADLGPAFFMAKQLPSMTMSYWFKNFSDKELGFHLILFSVRTPMRWFKANTAPPFHLEYLLFIFSLLLSYIFLAQHFKLKNVYLYVIAMVSISPFLITRLVVLRPHLLAMSVIFISCIFWSRITCWRKIWLPLVFGFIMAWCYSNPHFILLPAFAFAIPQLRSNWRLALAIPLITSLGIILGFIIHPQFPNTFINWKIQCIDVMLVSLNKNNPVVLGRELTPANTKFLLEQFWVFLLLFVNIFLFFKYLKACTWQNAKQEVIAFFIMSTLTTLGCLLAIRGVEYAVPFNLICLGLLIREQGLIHFLHIPQLQEKNVYAFAVIFLTVIASVNGFRYFKKAENIGKKPYLDFASWLEKSQLPPGTVIANVNWSDFPLLFYAAPQYLYSYGMDPMFGYYLHPAKISQIEQFRTGKRFLAPEQLYSALNSRYVFVSRYNSKLAADMYTKGYVAIYQGKDGDLFDLVRSLNSVEQKQQKTSLPK